MINQEKDGNLVNIFPPPPCPQTEDQHWAKELNGPLVT